MTLIFQAGGVFPNLTQNMLNMGVFLYLFPFLLALAIFYGILYWVFYSTDESKRKLPKSAIALISIILAFFVMLYSSYNPAIVQFMTYMSGTGLVVGSGILFIAILLGLMGYKIDNLTNKDEAGKGRWIFVIGILLIGIIIFFGAGGGNLFDLPWWDINNEFFTAIFVILIIGLAVWWLGNEGNGSGGGTPSK